MGKTGSRRGQAVGRQEWEQSARCAEQADDTVWFPAHGGMTREAKADCARCPVREACLEHALTAPEPYGIWGGVSEKARTRLLTKRARSGA